MLDVVCLHLEKEGKTYGAERVGIELKEIKSVPRATSWGVVKETKHGTRGSVSPFAQPSLPTQASGPEEGPLMATVRRRVGLGVAGKIPSVDKIQLKKGLPIFLGVQEQVGPRKSLAWASIGPGREHAVHLATL